MDLFYDGSQDVPLRFNSGRGPEGSFGSTVDPTFCESCNALIPASDMARGAATQVFGLALCESCRMRTRAEERVELYFCNRCQVSVPVYRVDTGEALGGDGRILCLGCREQENRRGILPVAALAVTLACILAVLLAWQWGRPAANKIHTEGPTAAAEGPVVSIEMPGLAEVLAMSGEASRRVDALSGGIDALEKKRVGMMNSLSETAAMLRRSREEFWLRMDLLESETRSLLEEVARALDRSAPDR